MSPHHLRGASPQQYRGYLLALEAGHRIGVLCRRLAIKRTPEHECGARKWITSQLWPGITINFTSPSFVYDCEHGCHEVSLCVEVPLYELHLVPWLKWASELVGFCFCWSWSVAMSNKEKKDRRPANA